MNLRFNFALSLPILFGLLSAPAHCAIPTATQVTMAKHIESGIEWANRLREETKKGRKLSIKEVDGDLSEIARLQSAMDLTANEIVRESPSEKIEGHFTEMRRFQAAAKVAVDEFRLARIEQPVPNYSKMKAAAKTTLKNLEEARHWHELELSEIEKNQRD